MDEKQQDDRDFKESSAYQDSQGIINVICEKTQDLSIGEMRTFHRAFADALCTYEVTLDEVKGTGWFLSGDKPSSTPAEERLNDALLCMVSILSYMLERTDGNTLVIAWAFNFSEMFTGKERVVFEEVLLPALKKKTRFDVPDFEALCEMRRNPASLRVPKETPVEVMAFETRLATYPAVLRRAREKFSERSMEFAEALAGTGPSEFFFQLGAAIGGKVHGMDRVNDGWDAEEEPLYRQMLEHAADAGQVIFMLTYEIVAFDASLVDGDLRKKYEPLFTLAKNVRNELERFRSMTIEGRDTGSLNISREKKTDAMRKILNRYTESMIKVIQEILPSK